MIFHAHVMAAEFFLSKWENRIKHLCSLEVDCLAAMLYYTQNLVVSKKKHNILSAMNLLLVQLTI